MPDYRCPIFYLRRAIILVGFWIAGTLFYSPIVKASVAAGDVNTPGKGQARQTPSSRVSDVPPLPATSPKTRARVDEEFELQQMLVETLDQVERNYVKGISRRELIEAAIEGVLRKLDDPYSTYINPEKLSDFCSAIEHEFGGIGIRVGMENGQLTVISPMVNTPAQKAGILAGDHILKIDGKPTKGLSLDAAVEMLQGKIGSDVTLKVVHRYNRAIETITVTRHRIVVETVQGDRRKPDGQWNYFLEGADKIGYVHITGFSRTTPDELRKVLQQLTDNGARAIILDLRFNPGGLLSSAVEVSDLFLPKGRIVSIAGRSTKKRSWDARKEGTFETIPVVVLVNHYTASAAEIVAAALQDNNRATVMGERTWGKGSVQNIIALEHGHSALKLTTSAYHRPNGENIHRFPDAKEEDKWGVTPDKKYHLPITRDEMNTLLLDRQRRDIVHSPSTKTPPLPPRTKVDRLLRKSIVFLGADAPGRETAPVGR
ncbi:MAG: S41 family peptidase [Planctomycetia bacterium]|jgi:carboxyl-terminal processing protease